MEELRIDLESRLSGLDLKEMASVDVKNVRFSLITYSMGWLAGKYGKDHDPELLTVAFAIIYSLFKDVLPEPSPKEDRKTIMRRMNTRTKK